VKTTTPPKVVLRPKTAKPEPAKPTIVSLDDATRIDISDGANWTVQVKSEKGNWKNLCYHARLEWALEWIARKKFADTGKTYTIAQAVVELNAISERLARAAEAFGK
jgi:hypothetical protein